MLNLAPHLPLLEREDFGKGVVSGRMGRRRLQHSPVQTHRLFQFSRRGPQPPQQDQGRRIRRGRRESLPKNRLRVVKLAMLQRNNARRHGREEGEWITCLDWMVRAQQHWPA